MWKRDSSPSPHILLLQDIDIAARPSGQLLEGPRWLLSQLQREHGRLCIVPYARGARLKIHCQVQNPLRKKTLYQCVTVQLWEGWRELIFIAWLPFVYLCAGSAGHKQSKQKWNVVLFWTRREDRDVISLAYPKTVSILHVRSQRQRKGNWSTCSFPFPLLIWNSPFLNHFETVVTIFELILCLQRCSRVYKHFINAQQAIFLITIGKARSVPAAVEDISLREVVSASSPWLRAVPTSKGSCGRRSLWASA